jgi:hypothetical protein
MGNRKEKVETITDMIIEFQPEFSALNREVIERTVDRHISYIISEIAVYQKHQQRKEDEYKKKNPLKIRITIDKTEQGYHIQAWHNGIVLTGYVSKTATPSPQFLKVVDDYSDTLLAEIVYPKEDKETTKTWEQLKSGGTQGEHYRIDS